MGSEMCIRDRSKAVSDLTTSINKSDLYSIAQSTMATKSQKQSDPTANSMTTSTIKSLFDYKNEPEANFNLSNTFSSMEAALSHHGLIKWQMYSFSFA